VTLPLAGVVVADYSQYVAGPVCTLLLADLGADVIKVEPPQGDQWRRQEPCGPDTSRPFVALNRNKRSVVIDLKSAEGRRDSRALIATADVVVHNCPSVRAERFGLDRASVLAANPRAVVVAISAFGSDGPDGGTAGYDLAAQAASGLLMADARVGDCVPVRAGGIAMTDFSAGMLAAVAALAGLAGARESGVGCELETSLLGAALTLQIQRFVSASDQPGSAGNRGCGATRGDLAAVADQAGLEQRINPYYRAYRTVDGFIAIACLNLAQRRGLLDEFGLEDRAAENPDEPPPSTADTQRRERLTRTIADALAQRRTHEWIARLGVRRVPCQTVRTLDSMFASEQARANGLVQQISQPDLGDIYLLGSPFKLDGASLTARRPAPSRGEHTDAVLGALSEPGLAGAPENTPVTAGIDPGQADATRAWRSIT
jgi:crotonobetainyl-CoA:carnitine CoA-transferase CaiB-like acyl-CoA transferase